MVREYRYFCYQIIVSTHRTSFLQHTTKYNTHIHRHTRNHIRQATAGRPHILMLLPKVSGTTARRHMYKPYTLVV